MVQYFDLWCQRISKCHNDRKAKMGLQNCRYLLYNKIRDDKVTLNFLFHFLLYIIQRAEIQPLFFSLGLKYEIKNFLNLEFIYFKTLYKNSYYCNLNKKSISFEKSKVIKRNLKNLLNMSAFFFFF